MSKEESKAEELEANEENSVRKKFFFFTDGRTPISCEEEWRRGKYAKFALASPLKI